MEEREEMCEKERKSSKISDTRGFFTSHLNIRQWPAKHVQGQKYKDGGGSIGCNVMIAGM